MMIVNLPLHRCHLISQPVLLTLLVLVLLSGCTLSHTPVSVAKNVPLFIDDGDPASLLSALKHQQDFVHSQSRGEILQIDGKAYSDIMLQESLAAFAEILAMNLSPLEQDRIIKNNFTIFKAGGRPAASRPGEMLVTGYYEPVLEGSLKKSFPFIYPLYSVPRDLKVRTTANGKKIVGRVAPEADNAFKPYWTREQIDSLQILQGNELAYLKDPFDVFLLHVQGSGRIRLQNGEIRAVRYRESNGHPYSSIGKLLVDEKKLTLSEADIPAIRKYLTNFPEEMSRVLNHNRRYIFFDWGDGESPRGSSGAPLTPERSVAIDKEVLPMKTVAFLLTERPVMDTYGRISHWRPMHRFVLPQDTGSAIKGSGRVDLFWGSGAYAEKAAGAMRHKGRLYFLIKKHQGPLQ